MLYPLLFASALSLSLLPRIIATPGLEVRGDLHFKLESRAENKDGSVPIYKNPEASIEDRVEDLLPRMTIEEKVSQLIQGDMNGWMNFTDPLDNTLVHNDTGLVEMASTRAGAFWGGYSTPWAKFVYGVTVGQKYLMENTTLGIPALIQSEGLHGFTNNGTIWPSPIGLAASFDTDLVAGAAATIADEAEGLGITNAFAPVLDLSRELRWGRVEENYGEDPFLTGEIGHAFVTGLQSGRRRNTSSTAVARIGAMCKHFAAFGSPQGGLNLAPVSGGERELRTMYLKPFHRACLGAMSIMTAYSTYDGIPATANTHLLTNILRGEWGYKYWVTDDAGSIDLLMIQHGVCETRECAAKTAIENGLSGEMGGGTYLYETIPDQVKKGTIDIKYVDQTVKYMLTTKFSLGLFENPYPYPDYLNTLRTQKTRDKLHVAERETIVLLENHNSVLPISKSISSIALIGPQVDTVTFGDYVFHGASDNGISPLAGFTEFLSNTSVKVNYAEGCKRWSNDQSGFAEAVSAAETSEVAIVMVGTWSRDQNELWQGLNATTGEHVDVHDLALVGAQLALIKAIKATGKPTIVVLISGKPVAEPWIQANADAVVQQFYPGELGGLALAEIIFGDANPSGKLPVSFPRDVGTTPIFYNSLKGAYPRFPDPGQIFDNGTIHFGHAYVLESPVPLWSFGHGLSYTTFNYTDLSLSKSSISTSEDFSVTVTVHNTGKAAGKEVVQVYMTDVFSSVTTPNQELVGFKKIDIPAGGSEKVTIPVLSSQLAVWSISNQWVVEPGIFDIKIGTSDQVFLTTNLTVV